MQRQQTIILTTILIASASLTGFAAAQGTDDPIGLGKDVPILGISSVTLALLVAVSAVALRTWQGLIHRNIRELNFNLLGLTFITGVLVAIPLSVTALENLHPDATASAVLIVIAGEILTIAGADSIAKRVGKLAADKKAQRSKVNDDVDEDDEDDESFAVEHNEDDPIPEDGK